MGFDSLLGNDRLKHNLTAALARNRISHFYLISGPEGSGKKTLAQLLAAGILCSGSDSPCLTCSACRKVMADTHPDFITVQDPEHKNISVSIVRQIRDDMFVLPNEADKKIYVFSQDLGIEGQNALLKILEEPPSYGVFMLLTDNPEKLLPTVRSRCTHLQLQALQEDILRHRLQKDFPAAEKETISAAISRSGGYLGQALQLLQDDAAISPQTQSFCAAFSQRSALELTITLIPMEKWKRDQLIPELSRWTELLQQALVYQNGLHVLSPIAQELGRQRSAAELMQAVRHLQKAIEYAQGNVSPAAICGWLAWALR